MSHTQGPWALNRYGEVICSTGEMVQVEGFALSGISRPETRANRALMSAAPELKQALIDLKREVILSDIPNEHIEKLYPLFEAARAAIEKAEQV